MSGLQMALFSFPGKVLSNLKCVTYSMSAINYLKPTITDALWKLYALWQKCAQDKHGCCRHPCGNITFFSLRIRLHSNSYQLKFSGSQEATLQLNIQPKRYTAQFWVNSTSRRSSGLNPVNLEFQKIKRNFFFFFIANTFTYRLLKSGRLEV